MSQRRFIYSFILWRLLPPPRQVRKCSETNKVAKWCNHYKGKCEPEEMGSDTYVPARRTDRRNIVGGFLTLGGEVG